VIGARPRRIPLYQQCSRSSLLREYSSFIAVHGILSHGRMAFIWRRGQAAYAWEIAAVYRANWRKRTPVSASRRPAAGGIPGTVAIAWQKVGPTGQFASILCGAHERRPVFWPP
jgi:hypothetical protein